MMDKLTDTHCHLYLEEFSNDGDEVIKRAKTAGVERFYLPNIDSSSIAAMLELESKYPGECFAMMGLHPCSVKENYRDELDIVSKWLTKRKFAGVGETGLDFYWDMSFEKQQYEAFHAQIDLAIQYHLPIVIHSRNSLQQCIDAVKSGQQGNLQGIFHCFSGSFEEAKQVIDLGFYLGIGGVVTYKNSGLTEVIKKAGLSHVVSETDAPYLTPVPLRGKRNESSYLKYVIEKLSAITGKSEDEVTEITTANARKIFNSSYVSQQQ